MCIHMSTNYMRTYCYMSLYVACNTPILGPSLMSVYCTYICVKIKRCMYVIHTYTYPLAHFYVMCVQRAYITVLANL